MWRWLVVVLMAGWAPVSVRGEVEEISPMHWWTDGAGSNVDAQGNIWNVYAANGNPNPQLGTAAWDTWTPLSYDGGAAQWGGRPGFNSARVFTADGYYLAPGLIVQAGGSGRYSWQGSVSVLAFADATLTFGKIVGGAWSSLFDLTVPLYGTQDLSAIGALQNIPLGIGDQLTVYIRKTGGGWTDCSMADVSIGYVSDRIPFWTGTDGTSAGNPYADEIGYKWGVYHTYGNTSPQFGTGSAWSPLPYNAAPNIWGYVNEEDYRPGFTSEKVFQATGYYNAPGLAVQVPSTAIYSWKGSLTVGSFSSPMLVFGKIVGGTWSSLYISDRIIPPNTSFNLGTVSELQNVPLGADDCLTLYIGKPSGGWTDVGMGGVGICGRVPTSPGSTTYYIDSTIGDDRNTGVSPASPWASLAAVNATQFAPGDRILFKAGTRYTGHLCPQGSGAAGLPIVIDSYGTGGKPRIDGQGSGVAVYLLNVEYWEVNNLEITNQGAARVPYIYGVLVQANNGRTAHHIQLRSLYVHDVLSSNVKSEGGGGIYWTNAGTGTPTRFDGLLIENCHLVRTDRNGIVGGGFANRAQWYPSLNVVIRGNLLEDIGGDGILVIATDGCLVEYNIVRGARTRAEDYALGIWPWGADNTTFQFNEVSGVRGTKEGQGFDSDYNCQNSLFQYNYSHDNEGGFFLICNYATSTYPENIGNIGTIIRYNVSQNDGSTYYEPIFAFDGNPQDVQIYNNTIYVGKYFSGPVVNTWEWVGGWPTNVRFSNNIFYVEGAGSFVLGSSGYTFTNNVYYGNFSNRPADSGAITVDPKLLGVNTGGDGIQSLTGYGLLPDSPCAASGVSIAGNGGADFLGAAVSSPPSRGAFEYGPAIVETAPWVTYITHTTAQCGGQVVNQGASAVTARGVCWGTSPLPTVAGSHTSDGTGIGSYTSTLTGLSPSTIYYIRAYASNGSGIRYGHELKFTTAAAYPTPTVPTVITSSVADVTESSATCGGMVSEDGWSAVTNRGVCWSTTSASPTVSDNILGGGSGTGSYSGSLTTLSANTVHYLRAFATNAQGTAYGETVVFTTETVMLIDGFETGLANWSTDWSQDTGRRHSGSYSVRCNWIQNDLTSMAMDTRPFDTLDIEFWFYNQGVSASDSVYLQFYNGSEYTTIANLGALTPQGTWNHYQTSVLRRGVYIPYFNPSFRIRFTGAGVDFLEYFWIDDVKVRGGYTSHFVSGEQSVDWEPPVSLVGVVKYEGYVGDNATLGVTFELQPIGGGEAMTGQVFLDGDGSFHLEGITRGAYTLAARSHGSLRTVVGTVAVMDNPTVLSEPIVLRGVDPNGDNNVDFADFSMLQNSYGERGDSPLSAAAVTGPTGGCAGPGLGLICLCGAAVQALLWRRVSE